MRERTDSSCNAGGVEGGGRGEGYLLEKSALISDLLRFRFPKTKAGRADGAEAAGSAAR